MTDVAPAGAAHETDLVSSADRARLGLYALTAAATVVLLIAVGGFYAYGFSEISNLQEQLAARPGDSAITGQLQDTIRRRDEAIAALNIAQQQRDATIAGLNQTIQDQDRTISDLRAQLGGGTPPPHIPTEAEIEAAVQPLAPGTARAWGNVHERQERFFNGLLRNGLLRQPWNEANDTQHGFTSEGLARFVWSYVTGQDGALVELPLRHGPLQAGDLIQVGSLWFFYFPAAGEGAEAHPALAIGMTHRGVGWVPYEMLAHGTPHVSGFTK